MIVHRKCYLSQSIKNSATKSITTNWANVGKATDFSEGTGKINPKITLYYSEALPKNYTSKYPEELTKGIDLDVYLYHIKMDTYKNDGSIAGDFNDVYYDKSGNAIFFDSENNTLFPDKTNADGTPFNEYIGNSPRQFTCSNSNLNALCNDLEYVDIEATYKITYGNKLTWYSDKSDDDKAKNEILEADQSDAKYMFIGYGLPTSFVTPTLSGNYHYGYSLSSKDNGGALYVTVSQIGTQISTDQYHFDKYLEFNLSDDSDGSDRSKIYYSCGFNIQNYLFDTECPNGICNNTTCDENNVCEPSDAPKGLDVVFRTIELVPANSTNSELEAAIKKAFPGRIGNGREKGANWAIYTESGLKEILSTNAYYGKPMYEITLDVKTINAIRKNNQEMRKAGADPYTSKDEKYYTFSNSDKAYSATDASDQYKFCSANYEKNTEAYDSCNKIAYAMLGGYVSVTVDTLSYTRATSKYLSDLTSLGLKGYCIDGLSKSDDRGMYYAIKRQPCRLIDQES